MDTNEELRESASQTTFERVVAGIGASAGGLEALKKFFHNVPQPSGIAFVVVVHLAPEYESHLADILQAHVDMPVVQVTEAVILEADHVYVIPPGSNLSAVGTGLQLEVLEQRARERAPIDHFLRTLATTHNGLSIAIILTGTGSDGALGIREIKEAGGLTIVQDPDEAEYDGMPHSAISTGFVDVVLPLVEIPDYIVRYARTRPSLNMPEDSDATASDATASDERLALQQVFARIRARTGRDFSRYKRSTLLRRIQRRMQLHQIRELRAYLDVLDENPEEIRALADEFLITVTSFFRDPEVFATLANDVIPRLFDGALDHIRVWSVGCATGEEAYSLAILLLEEAGRRERPPQLQVFASDLHERSLAVAREGSYPDNIELDVSPERLARFFHKQDGGYHIRAEVRELVVFAPHNLLADPPFSKIDLISCRNLLIYLQRDVQRDVVDLFHYAIKPEGFLLVGTSETIERTDLFGVVHKKHGLYRRRSVAVRDPRLPVFAFARSNHQGEREQLNEGRGPPMPYEALHRLLIERSAPPSVLVNSSNEVVHVSVNGGRYLQVPGGEPTTNLFKLVPEELRVELRAALSTAESERRAVLTQPVPVESGGRSRGVVVRVDPVGDPWHEGFSLLTFEEHDDHEDHEEPRAPEGPAVGSTDSEALHAELDATKRRLQGVIEKYEISQEEMKAANEELQSANEELRSMMEELETSKEELQSVNEELTTLNQENRHRVEELSQLSGDLQNLMAATDIATLFLDCELRILRFTPRIGELFNVRASDRGRPLTDLTHRLGYGDLVADADRVLDKLVPIEREARDQPGRWYLIRLLPYRSADRIGGVVITFVEITTRKLAEQALQRKAECDEFRLALSDALRQAGGTKASQLAATRLLGEHLGVDRVSCAEVSEGGEVVEVHASHVRGSAEAPVEFEFEFALAEFGVAVAKELSGGRTVSVGDVGEDPRLDADEREAMGVRGVESFVIVPIVDRGATVGLFVVEHGAVRVWAPDDLALIEETAERMWTAVERGRAEQAVREADRRKDEFLATLAHELRNPLAPMVSAVELLQINSDPGQNRRLYAVLERQIQHMVRLVDDLLDVSRITRGVIELRKESVELASLLRKAIEINRPLLGVGRELCVDLGIEPLMIEADPTRIVQVFANLLNNAAKYTGSQGRIWLTVSRDGAFVRIELRDDGIGIDPHMLSEVFDLFTQVDRKGQSGLGVGLTLVRNLVEMHGGTVEAHSEGLGHGSEFVVRLPLVEADRLADASKDTHVTTLARLEAPRRALVVDDNHDAADSLGMLLEQLGAQVEVVYSGRDALARFREWRPRIVFLDLGMPELDGYEVARTLRREFPDEPFTLVAVTGWGQADDCRRVREAGFDHHLVKPAPAAALASVLAGL